MACDMCIYYQEENFCLRKNTNKEEKNECLHYVNRLKTKSMEKMVEMMAEVISSKEG